MEALVILLGIGFLVVGAVVVIRVLTMPGEVRALREAQVSLQRELRTQSTRVDGLRSRLDRIEGGGARETPPVAVLPPETPHEDELAPYEPELEIDASVARFLARSGTTAVDTPAPSQTPPPLPINEPVLSARSTSLAPVETGFERWLKSLGPKDKNMTWEMALGTYWLPRLGALAITTAIVFLLTLAFQKWGASFRVATGYTIAALFLGLGWRFDRKYPAYARVLFGAGFALSYFVTFATYFVPFAKVLDAPYLSLAGLAAIVIVWAGLAQRRRSPVIAGVAVAMGHFTIALATYSIARPGPYSVAGIVFLSIGGAFFLARNGWYAVAALGLVASYVNHFYLMTQVESTHTRLEFATGMAILSTYFLVYALAEFAAPESIRRGRIPLWFRNAFVAVNSFSLLLLGTAQFSGYDFARDEREIFYYLLAAVLLAISIAYLRLRNADPLHNAYFAKGITALTIGLATQFDAHTLTASLAVESAVLLYAARRNGLLVTRIVALIAGALAFLHGGWTIVWAHPLAYGAEGYWPRVGEAGTVVLAFLAAALVYLRTEWASPSPARSRFSAETNLTLWKLDLVAAPPAGLESATKPFGGMLLPGVFSLCAALLAAGYAHHLAAPEDLALVLVAGGLLLTLAAMALRATPYGLASFVLAAFGSCVAGFQFRGLSLPDLVDGAATLNSPLSRVVPILIGFAAIALASEKRYLGAFKGLALHQGREVAFVLYGVFAFLLGLHLDHSMATPAWTVAALLIAAVALAAAAIPLNRQALAWCATAMLAWAVLRWNAEWSESAPREFLATAWIGIAAAVAAERHFARLGVKLAGPICMGLAASLFVPYVYRESPPEWVALWWTVGGVAFALHSGFFRGRTAAALAVGTIAAASLYQAIYTQNHHPGTWAIVAGFAAPALCWIAIERVTKRFAARAGLDAQRPALQALAASLATGLLVLMLYRLPQLAEYYLTISWSVLGMALFGLAIGLGEKLYRYCGLAVLALASLRVVAVDTRELETVEKVLAYGVLGVILLALGYGYVRVFARNARSGPPSEN